MSQPDALRAEFESFRDATETRLHATERELVEVRALATSDDAELSAARANTRLIQALRQTQLDQGRLLDEHTHMLAEHGRMLYVLSSSVAGLEGDVSTLKTDVADLKTDVSTLKTDVSTLKSNVAGILRILDERLPPKA